MSKILITGAAGFIGSRLFNKLKLKHEVLGVDFNLKEKLHKKIINLDLINEKETSKLVNDFHPSFVFHLAAFAGPPRNSVVRACHAETSISVRVASARRT